MRVCHVITRMIIGGAQENTLLTCRGLMELGHDVSLVAGPETGPEGSLWPQVEQSGCTVHRVDSLRRAVRPLSELRALRSLAALFRRIQPDVVHTHSSKAGILGRMAAARVGVPVVIHTIHGMSFNRTQSAPVRTLYRWLERRAARYTTAFITVADSMIEQAVEAGMAPRDRFTTIRSGMRTELYAPDAEQRAACRTKLRFASNEFVVGTVARLFENKGYEQILAAMPAIVAAVPHARFLWIGDGRHRERYLADLDRIGLRDRVTLTGLIPPEDIPAHLNACDVLVHASKWEGLPRAVVQGLLMKVPAVSFDNDGAPEVVLDGQTGILVRYGDIDGLVHGVVYLAQYENLRRRLGSEGRRRCLVEFDWRKMVEDIDRLYQRLQKY